jgi:hypothetical protein
VNENGVAYFVRPEGVEYPLRIVYPYGIVKECDPTNSDNITIILPYEYTYATVQEGPGVGRQNVPAPLCAKIDGTGEGQIPNSAFFEHITAAITVAVKNASSIPIYIKSLKVNNKTSGLLCGELTVNVSNPQVEWSQDEINRETDKNEIEMSFPQGVCRVDADSVGYIQIPIRPLQSVGGSKMKLDFDLKASPASDDLIPFEMYYQRTQNGTTGITIARSQLAYVPIELDPNDRSDVENGVCDRAKLHYKIDGVFSISETEKVYFSRGNLKYMIGSDPTSNASWEFFSDQDASLALTKSSSNETKYDKSAVDHPGIDGWVDLFLFGAKGNPIEPQKLPYAVSSIPYTSISPNDNDWGRRVGDGQWFTLSEDQWSYLLGTRTMFAPNGTLNDGRFAVAKRLDNQGAERYVLVIFPDKYWVQTSQIESVSSNVVIDDDKYAKLQAAGVAILPATGQITKVTNPPANRGSLWNGLGTFYYWTSDYKQLKRSSNAYQFVNGGIFSSAVRLVRNAAHSNNQSNN